MGGEARLVRVEYPHRIGYGLHPFMAIGVGLVVTFVGMRARRFFNDVARGDALTSVYERFPEQTDADRRTSPPGSPPCRGYRSSSDC